MDMRKFTGSSFIKPDDVRSGPINATILEVTEGKYGKPDLLFSSGARLSLNATNCKVLVAAFGSDDSDWVGQEIEMRFGQLKYNGTVNDAVLVKATSAGVPEAERKEPPPEQIGRAHV